jgi:hypothetical protein
MESYHQDNSKEITQKTKDGENQQKIENFLDDEDDDENDQELDINDPDLGTFKKIKYIIFTLLKKVAVIYFIIFFNNQ